VRSAWKQCNLSHGDIYSFVSRRKACRPRDTPQDIILATKGFVALEPGPTRRPSRRYIIEPARRAFAAGND